MRLDLQHFMQSRIKSSNSSALTGAFPPYFHAAFIPLSYRGNKRNRAYAPARKKGHRSDLFNSSKLRNCWRISAVSNWAFNALSFRKHKLKQVLHVFKRRNRA